MLKRYLLAGCLALSALALSAGAASAETLMMPKRDALMGTAVVVWGVTTLPNGSAFTMDYGDGTTVTGSVSDRSYIAFSRAYAASGHYTATLTVTDGSTVESASVALQVFDGGAMTADNLRSLRINMAIQDGLRYLWVAQSNRSANFPASPVTNFRGGGSYDYGDTALVVLAFQNHGYKLPNSNAAPTGLYEKYLVRRGLNYVISRLSAIALSNQPAGNPCVGSGTGWSGSDCRGLSTPTNDGHSGYGTPVAMLPFASSGALNRVNTEVGGAAANMTYGEILQRLVNTQVWGQSDTGAGRGGFGYTHNDGRFDGSTVGWAILGLLDAEAAGATLPAFVRTEFAFGLANAINFDGSFDYQADGSPNTHSAPGPQKVGIGLQGLFFIGDTGSRVNLVASNINSWWNGGPGIGPNSWGGPPNKGSAYSMFNNFKGLKLAGISTLPNVNRPAGPGSQPANDWYADYQDWLVTNQTSPNNPGAGYWNLSFSCCYSGLAINTAIAELILSPVALVLPDEDKFSTVGLRPATDTKIEGGTHTVTAKAETASGSPVPGTTVTFKVLTGPNAGTNGTAVTGANGEASYTYTGSGGVGKDTIQAFIGALSSNTVEMNWVPRNTPPVAEDDAYTTDEDTALSANVTGNDTDADGDALTATLVSGVSNGTLVFNADGSFVYTPAADWFGTDSFTYQLNDGTVDGNVATVTITVNSVNDAPICDSAAPSISLIWPPNHQMVPVSVLGVTDPVEGSAISILITSIFQDEPTLTVGDGNTPIDGDGVGTATAQVRAERSGNPRVPGNGRVYHISFLATDADGGTCTGLVKVGVPHDQGQRSTPVDDGPKYKSTGGGS
ncbi:MAG TPA: Ig-like domain-containing protein [Vicinamibacterales bacterium]|nr:Ig-like domain-containing protein [Vicinamibacterales bacterium]